MRPEEPSFKTRLVAHAAVFCAALGGFMNLYCTQAIYPELSLRFGLTVADAGALLTATTLGLALTAPFAGRVANRLGPFTAILVGIAALTGSTVLFGFAHERSHLVGLRLLQGMLIPVVLSALLASINALWDGALSLAISATYVTGTVIGGLIGRFLPAFVMPSLGWQGAFATFGAIQCLLLVLVWFLYPRVELASRAELPLRAWLAGLWPMMRTHLVGVSVAGFCLLFTQTAITTYIAIRLASQPYGWGTEALGALYAVFLPALIFVRLTPHAMARLGTSRTLGGALCLGWLGLALTLSVSVPAILGGLVMFSVSVFIAQTVLANLVGLISVENKEMTAGIYLSFYYLGGSIGALAPALLWSHLGWVGCVILVGLVQFGGFMLVRFRGSKLSRVVN